MKILVVDDVGYTRHYHTRLLQKHGHSAVSAAGGGDALKMLRTDHSIDVVLTDLMMGDMDGIELFQEVQRMGRMNDAGAVNPPKFVLMTALHPGKNTQPRDVERIQLAKQIGFEEVMFKPVEHEDLLKVLEKVVRKGKSTAPKVDVKEALRQLEGAVNGLIAGNQAEDMNDFLDQAEPLLMKLRDKALESMTS